MHQLKGCTLEIMGWESGSAENGTTIPLFLACDTQRCVNNSISQLDLYFLTSNLQVKDIFPCWTKGDSSFGNSAITVSPNKASMKKQKPVWQRATMSVTSCIIQLQPTLLGRKELVCHPSPPDTDYLKHTPQGFLCCLDYQTHATPLELCLAQPSQAGWQPSTESTSYCRTPLPYQPFSFLSSSPKKSKLLFYSGFT